MFSKKRMFEFTVEPEKNLAKLLAETSGENKITMKKIGGTLMHQLEDKLEIFVNYYNICLLLLRHTTSPGARAPFACFVGVGRWRSKLPIHQPLQVGMSQSVYGLRQFNSLLKLWYKLPSRR